MSSRPSSTSSSSSDAAVRRRSSIVRLSFRPRPVRRTTTTRRTPSTSTIMTKRRAASQGTNPRDPALCWETTMWWSWSRSSLSRGSSPPAHHAHRHSPRQEARQSSLDSWSSWSHPRWKKSQRWQSERLQGQRWPPRFPLVARTGHSPPTGHSVLGSCSVLANQRGLSCVWMGHKQWRSLQTLPTELTWTQTWRSYPPMSQRKENQDNLLT